MGEGNIFGLSKLAGGGGGVPHLRSEVGGVPHLRSQVSGGTPSQGVPWPGLDGGGAPSHVWVGGYPISGPGGYPISRGEG